MSQRFWWLAFLGVLALVPASRADEQAVDRAGDPLPQGAIARLGSSRLRHTWGARVLAFSPGGKYLITGGEETGGGGENAIRVWEIPSGREIRSKQLGWGHHVNQVAISPDGETMVWIDSKGHHLQGIDYPTGLHLSKFAPPILPFDRRKPEPAGPTPLAFSHDGKFFATGAHGGLIVVDLKAKKHTVLARVGEFHHCAFSPNGKTLAINHPTKGLRLVNIDTEDFSKGTPLKFPALTPSCFAFSPDGDRLVTGDLKHVKVWDVATGKEVQSILSGTTLAVAFSSDGKEVSAITDTRRAVTWTVATGKETKRSFALSPEALPDRVLHNRYPISNRSDITTLLALSTDRNWFAVATQTNAVSLVNMNTGKKVAFADAQPGYHSTFAFAFTPDSKHIVTAGEDDRMQIWEARTGKLVRASKDSTESAYWFDVVPKADQIVSLYYGREQRRTVRYAEWTLSTAKMTRSFDLGITPGIPDMSPDGKWLAFGESNDERYRMHKTGDAVLYERTTGKEVHHFDAGDVSAPQDLTFSAKGKMLATINRTGVIRVWDTTSGKLLQTLKAEGQEGLYWRLRFVNGDKSILSTSMTSGEKFVASHVVEWSIATGKVLSRKEGPKDMYWCQAVSQDGKLIAWAGRHYRHRPDWAEIWGINEQAPRQSCDDIRGGARFLGFSPDSRLLAGASYDGSVLIYEVNQK